MTGDLFAGTAWLLRLNLRLDRIQIPAWTLGFLLLVWASVIAMQDAYPDDASLQARALLLSNPAAIMMTGPLFDAEHYTLGAAIANELMLYVMVPAAVMSVLIMARHTRADEQAGRTEMLRALPVGRFAPPTAAMITVFIANLLVGAAVAAGLAIPGGAAADSAAAGVGTAMTGLVFAAFTAVAAQISDNAATVRGMGLGSIAVAYMVRGFGDVINHAGSWLSWFSPFAWAQQMRPYVDLRWWPMILALAATLALAALSAALADRRDLGAGLRATRPGPAEAPRRLRSPAGLAWHRTSGMFLGWGIGLGAMAVGMGSLANSLQDMIDQNQAFQDWVELDMSAITQSFGALILSFLALGPAALIVAGILRLREEEVSTRTEITLVSGSSRTGYLLGWSAVVTLLSLVVLVVFGAATGLGMTLATGEADWVGELTLASLAYAPAVLVFGGLALALHGLVPRRAPLAWAVVVWASIVSMLGELFKLPDWARGLSPVWHTPLVPGPGPEPWTLALLTVIALALAVLGVLGFRRRDVGQV